MKLFKKLTAFVSAIVLSCTMCAITANAEHIWDVDTEEFDKRWSAFMDSEIDGLGDVNHDGFVNAVDASMVSYFYAELSTNNYDHYTEEEFENFFTYGNVNQDGYVDAIDAAWIAIKYAENSTPS